MSYAWNNKSSEIEKDFIMPQLFKSITDSGIVHDASDTLKIYNETCSDELIERNIITKNKRWTNKITRRRTNEDLSSLPETQELGLPSLRHLYSVHKLSIITLIQTWLRHCIEMDQTLLSLVEHKQWEQIHRKIESSTDAPFCTLPSLPPTISVTNNIDDTQAYIDPVPAYYLNNSKNDNICSCNHNKCRCKF